MPVQGLWGGLPGVLWDRIPEAYTVVAARPVVSGGLTPASFPTVPTKASARNRGRPAHMGALEQHFAPTAWTDDTKNALLF